MNNEPYHYPPDLVTLLISTIPLLGRSKQDTIEFFRGCGVSQGHLNDLRRRVATDRESISKFEIARTILRRVNEVGDSGLRARREVLRRVVEWEDYSTCWPDKALEAQGLVAKVRQMVNAKDAFTRIQQERDRERDERSKPQRDAIAAARLRREQRLALHRELTSLFGMTDHRERGMKFEELLNRIFGLDGLSVRESFTLTTDSGHVGEQIDGLIELGTQPYLVEAKWWSEPLGVNGVSRHLVRVYGRDSVHGLMVSASGFAEPAIAECRMALSKKVFVLAELREIVLLLERGGSFSEWLKSKTYAASVDRRPLFVSEFRGN